jgi:hypothetical protein
VAPWQQRGKDWRKATIGHQATKVEASSQWYTGKWLATRLFGQAANQGATKECFWPNANAKGGKGQGGVALEAGNHHAPSALDMTKTRASKEQGKDALTRGRSLLAFFCVGLGEMRDGSRCLSLCLFDFSWSWLRAGPFLGPWPGI